MSAANVIQQFSSQLSLQCIARSFLNQSTTVFNGVRFVMLAMEFVIENPWVLVHFVLPALKAWLVLLGYETVGSLAGSLATAMQSKYSDIPFQTLITFLQSYDERKWARGALRTARVLGTATFVAVVLVSFRNFLQEKEMQEWRVGGS